MSKPSPVYTQVLDCDDSAVAACVAAIREDYEGHSVRVYRRTVSADGIAIPVRVVVVRERGA